MGERSATSEPHAVLCDPSEVRVRVQRTLRIFEKFIHIIPFLAGFLLLYLIFCFEKWKRGWG